jgi:hypothetical protein
VPHCGYDPRSVTDEARATVAGLVNAGPLRRDVPSMPATRWPQIPFR